LLAANKSKYGHNLVVITAVLGAGNIVQAINDSEKLAGSTVSGFDNVKLVSEGQKVGSYALYDGRQIEVAAAEDLSLFTWLGRVQTASVRLDDLSYPISHKKTAGRVVAGDKSVAAVTRGSSDLPGFWQRLRRRW
jgi:hypothetical protein